MEVTFNDGYRTRTITINDNNSGICQHYSSVEMFINLFADDLGNMCSYFKDDDPRICKCFELIDYYLFCTGFTPNKDGVKKVIMKTLLYVIPETFAIF